MALRYAKIGNQVGWYDTNTQELLPSSAWAKADYNGKTVLFNKKTNESIPLNKQALDSELRAKPMAKRMAAKAGSEWGEAALRTGGALLGGAAALPFNIVAPGVAEAAGAGLGELTGATLARAARQYAGTETPTKSIGQAFKQTAQDIPGAAVAGMAGPVTSKLVGAAARGGGSAMGKAAERKAGTLIRMSPEEGLKKVPGRGVTKSEMIKQEILTQRPTFTERGVERMGAKMKAAGRTIAERQSDIDKTDLVNRQKLVKGGINDKLIARNAINDAMKEAIDLPPGDPDKIRVMRFLESEKKRLAEMPEYMSGARAAQAAKKAEQASVNWDKSGLSKPVLSRFKEVEKKSLAHQYRMAIEELDAQYAKRHGVDPVIAELNERIGATSELYDAIEREVYLANKSDRQLLFGLLRSAAGSGKSFWNIFPELPKNVQAKITYALQSGAEKLAEGAPKVAAKAGKAATVSAAAPQAFRKSYGVEEEE